VEECIDKYMKLSEKVFNHDHVLFGVLPTGERGVRFDASILEEVVQNLVEEKLNDKDVHMAEASATDFRPCPTFVVATSAAAGQGPPILFRSYDCEDNDADNLPIWKVARATTAAPSFFAPMFIDLPAPGAWYLDGGLRYNNPSQLALDEARQIWPRVKRFIVVSVGTGRQSNVEFVNIIDSHPPQKRSKSLFSRMISKVPGASAIKNTPGGFKELANVGKACVELSTNSEPTHEVMLKLAFATDYQTRFPYYRFNVDRGMDSIGLEEWKANVRIGELTRQYLREETRKLERKACVQSLISPAPVERT
jgi:predicted acylesterase/phospholipase RssA